MEFRYSDGGRSNYFKGTAGDCVCRAICNATGKDYKEVYDSLSEYIKKKESSKRRKHEYSKTSSARNGVPKSITRSYITEVLKWKWHTCMIIGSGCKVHLSEKELPKGALIVKCSKHLTCVKDGILYDTYDCSRENGRCVYGYWSED